MNPFESSASSNRWADSPAIEKLLFFLGLLALAVSVPPVPGALLVLAVVLAATIGCARVRAGLVASVIAGTAVFLVLGSLPLLIGWSGGPHLERAGVPVALDAVLRALAATAATLGLAVTTRMSDLLALARRAGMPAPLCHVTDLTYRMIGVLIASAVTARAATDLRLGLTTAGRALAAVGGQSALVFVRAVQRSRALAEAMSLRAEPGHTAVLADARPVRPSRVLAALGVHLLVAGAAWWLAGVVRG